MGKISAQYRLKLNGAGKFFSNKRCQNEIAVRAPSASVDVERKWVHSFTVTFWNCLVGVSFMLFFNEIGQAQTFLSSLYEFYHDIVWKQ
jgi:hypothetical protein